MAKLTRFNPTNQIPFITGQLVQMKSGGPAMTVVSVIAQPKTDDAAVHVWWFMPIGEDAWSGPHFHEFPSRALKAY